MEKFKSVWKYVFGVILFPVWWLIIFLWCLLLTVFVFVITLKWQLKDIIEGVTLSLDFFGFWKKKWKQTQERGLSEHLGVINEKEFIGASNGKYGCFSGRWIGYKNNRKSKTTKTKD
ncbi:hypothetical protein ACTG5T_10530 [Pasteurella multocida]